MLRIVFHQISQFHLSNYILSNHCLISCNIVIILFVLKLNCTACNYEGFNALLCANIATERTGQKYTELLDRYVLLSMNCDTVDELCPDSLKVLFKQELFVEKILYLCDSCNVAKSNVLYETDDRWVESLPYLISNCSDVDVKYHITDLLLENDSMVGLYAMWNNCDFLRLKNYEPFRKRMLKRKEIYLLGELAIIASNANNNKESQRILKRIKILNKKHYSFICELLGQHTKVTYYDYMIAFYELFTK